MSGNQWPFLGDSPVARARRVAQAYRLALSKADPHACNELDGRISGWGERWVMPYAVTYAEDQWITPGQAADMAAVSVATIATLRRRNRLTGRQRGKRWEYRAGEVIAAFTNIRARNGGKHRTPDTIRANGTRVSTPERQ